MTIAVDPRSHGFVWPDRPSQRLRRLTGDQVGQFNLCGFLVLERVVDRDTVDELVGAIDPIEQQMEGYRIVLDDGRGFEYAAEQITFTQDLVVHAPPGPRFLPRPARSGSHA